VERNQGTGLLTGRTISHYRIGEKLGAGGMGVVWRAHDVHLDRDVALKVLPSTTLADPDRKRRFIQEARAASALNHPNIITIYDIDHADGVDFIAMELVSGRSVAQVLSRKGLRVNDALKYAIQMADALAAAHARGIVHRDLKPANLMVDETGRVKILDFGLAKLTGDGPGNDLLATRTLTSSPNTAEGVIAGTLPYLSPEQADGKHLDARSDIFSFGAVLYEMTTGRRAFGGESVVSTLSAILRDHPKPAAEVVGSVPAEVDRIIERCLQKDPNRRYQHAGDLRIDLQEVADRLLANGGVRRPSPHAALPRESRRWWWFAAFAASAAAAFGLGWRLHSPRDSPPALKLMRLTADAGLSGPPALSPDGKLLAYSADRGRDGERDLWVKQVAGGQAIRLTSDGAGNTTPDFSPDGSTIVFRSNRDGGGIYAIPAFGGDVRLLAANGLNPRFSPDGLRVAYWVGSETIAPNAPASGTVWVVPASGGQPMRVGRTLGAARYPIWSSDGTQLLVTGYPSTQANDATALDWWLVSVDNDRAVKTGANEVLSRAGLELDAQQGCWLSSAETVIFSTQSGDTRNLWRTTISQRTGRATGNVERLTTGTVNEVAPSCASDGAVAFTSVETRTELWSLDVDFDHGKPSGSLVRLTDAPAFRQHVSLSKGQRYAAFASDQSGRMNIWIRDLVTGRESALATSPLIQRYPVTNASGNRVAFSVFESGKRFVFVAVPGSAPEELCEGCLRATDWSRDEKTLLVFGGRPYQINTLDVTSHRQSPLLRHPTHNLLYTHYSPDNRWVSFTERTQPDRGRIAVAPIEGEKPVPERAWITIAEAGPEDWANWSPDGTTLYFTSPRDGNVCLWGQRIDTTTHLPQGEPFALQHFHGHMFYRQGGWSLVEGRIAIVLAEDAGNVWMLSRSR